MNDIFIAAHHYQNESIIREADLVADSYRLAIEAARSDARFIIVCGVRFMAESVATLARPEQTVIHPVADAGCPMADMITREQAERAMERIAAATGREAAPLTYMNSSNAIKALTGARAGSICTSGNAHKIMKSFLSGERSIFFMPDRNLGMNTARELGVPPEETCIITSADLDSGRQLPSARVYLWDGYCPVHRIFSPADIEAARNEYPGITVTVHPECDPEVVVAADSSASTEGMFRQIDESSWGSVWGIGTEMHFIERMKKLYPNKKIIALHRSCCHDMVKIRSEHLDRIRAEIQAHPDGPIPGTIRISDEERDNARAALLKMVELTNA